MKALIIEEAGPSGVLQQRDVESPSIGPDEVLIRVVATALNRADVLQRQGKYPPPAGIDPRIAGLECAGEILEVGDEVGDFAVGDAVCALLGGGGYAEHVAVPAAQILPIPTGMSFTQAAALPEAACTVWSNFTTPHLPEVGAGVLIHGGTSGVGSLAVQIAKACGFVVAATAGGKDKVALLRQIGADIAIDYRSESFEVALEGLPQWPGASLVFDVVGASYLSRNVSALAMGGRVMLVGTQSGTEGVLNLSALMRKRGSVQGLTVRSRPVYGPGSKSELVAQVKRDVWPMIERGAVAPLIGAEVPLWEAAKFHRLSEEGGLPAGKIVFTL